MSLKFTILGCGSSLGVPRADGFYGKCDPKEKKNLRTRCSAIIQAKNNNILIDTSPDLRNQLISNKIKSIDKVLYTHPHADQTHGINDLRIFYLKNKKKIPLFADRSTRNYLKNTFTYCFNNSFDYPSTLKLKILKKKHIFIKNNKKILIHSIVVKHGKINSMCFIINKKCAYISDANLIFNKDLKFFKNLKYFVIDCLRYKDHPSHYNLSGVLNLIKNLKPKKTILTNLHSDLDYRTLLKILPKNVFPAYDGMTFNL